MVSNFITGIFAILWGASTITKIVCLAGVILMTIGGQTWDTIIVIIMCLSATSLILDVCTSILLFCFRGKLIQEGSPGPKPRLLPYLNVSAFVWIIVASTEVVFIMVCLVQTYELKTIVVGEMVASFVSFISSIVLLIADYKESAPQPPLASMV